MLIILYIYFILLYILYIMVYSPSNPHLQLLERLQGADLGTPQILEHDDHPTTQQVQVHLHIETSRRYLETARPVDNNNNNNNNNNKNGVVELLCKNFHEMCTLWALSGECEVNPNCK